MSRRIETEQELRHVLSTAKEAVILFYSEWCFFSAGFLPVFEKHSRVTRSFYRVSTDDMPDIEDEFGIEVVPSVLVFRDGEVTRRLDGVPGVGLAERQLAELLAVSGMAAKTTR